MANANLSVLFAASIFYGGDVRARDQMRRFKSAVARLRKRPNAQRTSCRNGLILLPTIPYAVNGLTDWSTKLEGSIELAKRVACGP
jgi:hypothetical protein